MPGEGQDPVPKFGSFKPRKSTANGNASNSKNNREQREAVICQSRVETPKSDRDHRHKSRESDQNIRDRSLATGPDERRVHRERHRERNRNRDDPKQERRPRSSPSLQDHRTHSSDLYITDIKGDPSNLQYRRPNKWTVPLYHLYGSGSILGHPPDVKIDRALSDEQGYTLRYPTKSRSFKFVSPVDVNVHLDVTTSKMVHDRARSPQHSDGQVDQADFLPMPEQLQRKKGRPFNFPHTTRSTMLTRNTRHAHRHRKGVRC